MKKVIPQYKNRVISLPAEVLEEKLSTATKEELAVLIAVCDQPDLSLSEQAARLELTETVYARALQTWVSLGALRYEEEEDESAEPEEKKKHSAKRVNIYSSMPHYSQEEVANVVETTEGCSDLLDSCQQVLGKMFNVRETECVIRLLDHLRLPADYILTLCHYAAEHDKKSVRFVEQLALDFYDHDIITTEALERELKYRNERQSFEGYVKGLFGLGSRTLIKKEKTMLAAWSEEYHFSRDMISLAYEETISKIGKPSLDYANRILENWYAAGYKTVEEVTAAEKARNGSKPGSSFNTDDFFEAALKQSYSDYEN